MTEKKLQKCVNYINTLINTHLKDRKELFEKLFENIQERYFTSPASSKKSYHSSYPGGLAVHSISVTKMMLDIANVLNYDNTESVVIVGLLHDIGKIGDNRGNKQYIEQTDDWKKSKGDLYSYNFDLDSLTHAQRSIQLLNYYNFPLSNEEWESILLHDGSNVKENQTIYAMNTRNKLLRIAQFADSWVTFIDKI